MSMTQTSAKNPQPESIVIPEYFSEKRIAARYDITRQTVRLWVRQGKLPKPIKLGVGTTRWKFSDLLAFEHAAQEVSQ